MNELLIVNTILAVTPKHTQKIWLRQDSTVAFIPSDLAAYPTTKYLQTKITDNKKRESRIRVFLSRYKILFPERAFSLGLGNKRLLSRNYRNLPVVIPLALGLRGRLHLHQEHVVHHPTILTYHAILCKKVIHPG
jgi:hypothetical protein